MYTSKKHRCFFARTWLCVAFMAIRVDAGDPPLAPMLELASIGSDPTKIDFDLLPTLDGTHAIVTRGTREWQFRLHNYLVHHDGKYWCMWSHGPVIEDNPRQHVRFATSADGLTWSAPQAIMPPSPRDGFRYIARGFWVHDGRLLALATHDEAFDDKGRVHFFGESLELLAWEWRPGENGWQELGVVFKDAINNFPPRRLPNGVWGMMCRDHRRRVFMLTGGKDSPFAWSLDPIADYVSPTAFRPEEPDWWGLPDGRLLGLFRDNSKSGRLYRATSSDHGRSWSVPEMTNFPDATSKFVGIRLSRGDYVLVSNPNPARRNPLCLAWSRDGVTFTHMARLPIPATDEKHGSRPANYDSLQYPHVIEHGDSLLVAFSRNKRAIEVARVALDEMDRLIKGN